MRFDLSGLSFLCGRRQPGAPPPPPLPAVQAVGGGWRRAARPTVQRGHCQWAQPGHPKSINATQLADDPFPGGATAVARAGRPPRRRSHTRADARRVGRPRHGRLPLAAADVMRRPA